MTRHDRLRFEVPLYTIADVARVVEVNPQTAGTWIKHTRYPPLVTSVCDPRKGYPRVPFVGLAEALVLAAVRKIGLPMQRVRPALMALKREMDVEYALAYKRLLTDGTELLVDFAKTHANIEERDSARELVVIRHGQRVFEEIVKQNLWRIEYAHDDYPSRIKIVGYDTADIVVDPTMSFGQPIFKIGGVRVTDVLERIRAGERMADVAEDFRVPVSHVEDAWNVTAKRAA